MNPLHFPGPLFLLFYAAVSGTVLLTFWLRGHRDTGQIPKLSGLTEDPYLIANLRGGERETILVAIFNLVDRGFLGFQGNDVRALRPDDASMLRRPLDRARLEEARRPAGVHDLAQRPAVAAAVAHYDAELVKRGLLMNAGERTTQRALGFIAAAGLGALALAKIVVALRTGHSNIMLLVILALLANSAVRALGRSRTTPLGRKTTHAARELFLRLRGRSTTLTAGGATNDALFLACAFGLAALPNATFPFLATLAPRRTSSGLGSGDSSSCGSSCGSGCGGGGGCGGCGS